MNGELAVVPDGDGPFIMAKRRSIDQMMSQRAAIVEAMATIMRRDIDYGTIPGTPKPTLYMHGSADNALGAELANNIEQYLAEGSEVEIFEGLNHFLHLEDPGTVNKRILEFVSR